MKIGLNLIPFSSVQGIEIYTQNIIKHLLKINKEVFFIFKSSKIFDFQTPNTININFRIKNKINKAFFLQTVIYFLLKKEKIDILFSPSLQMPVFFKKNIVVIHDCAYDRFPEFAHFISKIYFKILFYASIKFSKKIITVSNFSKKELINVYNIREDKVEVIYEGVPELPTVEDDFIEKILQKFNIDTPYFIYIGNQRYRKNILGIIRAFKIFQDFNKKNYKLIIVGKKDKRFLNLEKEIKKNNLEKETIITDFVSEKEKVALYKRAKALIFPSFYEGFGLPILEAQSLNLPVLTSSVSSLPEVAGDGAFYVDPFNIEEISEGMKKLSENESLCNELIKKGLENIKRFSWQRSANQLMNVFNSL